MERVWILFECTVHSLSPMMTAVSDVKWEWQVRDDSASSAAERHCYRVWDTEWSSRKLQKKYLVNREAHRHLPPTRTPRLNWAESEPTAKQRAHWTEITVALGQINYSNSWNHYTCTLICRKPPLTGLQPTLGRNPYFKKGSSSLLLYSSHSFAQLSWVWQWWHLSIPSMLLQ